MSVGWGKTALLDDQLCSDLLRLELSDCRAIPYDTIPIVEQSARLAAVVITIFSFFFRSKSATFLHMALLRILTNPRYSTTQGLSAAFLSVDDVSTRS